MHKAKKVVAEVLRRKEIGLPCVAFSVCESVNNTEIRLSVFTVVATSVENKKKVILEGPFLSEGIKVVALDCMEFAACKGLWQKS